MLSHSVSRQRRYRWARVLAGLALCGLTLTGGLAGQAAAEGSGALYPEGVGGYRANLEWRTSSYGQLLRRRTLLYVYAEQGEYILVGSSAIAVPDEPDKGDVRIYLPHALSGPIGQEVLPAQAAFSCRAQRAATREPMQGRISSRAQELHGPDTILDPTIALRGRAAPLGYLPCFYRAPATGIYAVVFSGPAGDASDAETLPSGKVDDHPANVSAAQNTSVAMWDVSVREQLDKATSQPGRLFTYYLTRFTGGNGRPMYSAAYIVSDDGFVYHVRGEGFDPNGYIVYANQVGFFDSDGQTPLYHDVLAVDTLSFDEQNQLVQLQGDAHLAPPSYPIFFSLPDPRALDALEIPTTPTKPVVQGFGFYGPDGDATTRVAAGGTFRFAGTSGTVFELVISRDGVDFDPALPENRVLRGVHAHEGLAEAAWDGRDNTGAPFPAGSYLARITLHGGELHLPFLDVENSTAGGPSLTLLNAPGGVCPQWNGSCSGAHYDDTGYRTANGTLVGTAVDGPLCAGEVGNPPEPPFSDRLSGFESTSGQRRFGFATGGNPSRVCAPDGGFGDKKGLDLWTYYPSAAVTAPLTIVLPTAVLLRSFAAAPDQEGVSVRWETAAEWDSWSFAVLRGDDGVLAHARVVSAQPIAARGTGGGAYRWIDRQVAPAHTYYYWLQEHTRLGARYNYGPATLTLPAHSGTGSTDSGPERRILLPIVAQIRDQRLPVEGAIAP
jgi:hypothetical protein